MTISDIKSNTYSILNKWKDCSDFIQTVKNKKPLFVLVIGATATSLIPGISAAGRNTEELKLTPALDAEYLVLIQEKFNKKIPVSPSGIPSPVILTKAVLKLLGIDIVVIDAGAYIKPECEHISLNMGPGECISTGNSLGPIKTKFLLQKGEKFSQNLKSKYDYVIVGECIPGGTTTGLSLLASLGIDAFDLTSSSSPEGNHFIKNFTVKEALMNHVSKFSDIKNNPVKALEYFGDPVQAFITGFLKGTQKENLPVLLAGGSQMIAIYYLTKLMLEHSLYETVIGSTSWVANDKNAKVKRLCELTDAPFMFSNVSFSSSQFDGLKAYEEGHIKEGVGAGGMMIAANLYKNFSLDEIFNAIETEYQSVKDRTHA